MKYITCTGTLIAVAVAGYSGTALAQQDCGNEIEALRTQLEQRQTDQQRRQQVSRVLDQAERAGPGECQRFVTQARQQLRQAESSAAASGAGQRPSDEGVSARAPGYEYGQPPEQQQAGQQQQQQQQQQAREEQERARQQQEQARQQAQQAREQQQQEARQQQQVQQQRAREDERDAGTMDVQVEQAPAQVQIEQGVPRVIVRQQPPKVTVEQQPPIIEIVQPEAQVRVDQADPQVRVDGGEAEVEVQGGEAEVEVIKAGEPIVRLISAEGEAARQARAAEQQATGEEAERQTIPQQAAEQQPPTQQPAGVARQARDAISEAEAQQLIGRDALSRDGEEVGTVSDLVRARIDNSMHVIVDVGGFFGIGQRPVAIPLERGAVDQEGNLHLEMTRDQLEQLQRYDEEDYVPVQ